MSTPSPEPRPGHHGPKDGPKDGHRNPHVWVSSTYFGQGFPYAVVNNMAEILFKELGASLQVIGLTSLFHLPWNLKFLWGPLVDGFESKRRWLLATEWIIVALLVALALLVAGGGQAMAPIALGFLVLGLLSATHDIAIDGYYLEALDEVEQSRFVGNRVSAYKVAVLVVGGPLVALCALVGWTVGLALTALIMAGLATYHLFFLPPVETPRRPWTALAAAVFSPRALPLFAAALLLVVLELRWAVGTSLQFWFRDLPWVGGLSAGGWIGLTLLLGLGLTAAVTPALVRRLKQKPKQERSDYVANFVSFLEQPKVGLILGFVLLFRTGESFLHKMRWPFLDDVVGLPLEVYGVASGTIGVLASFAAILIGGRLIARDGLRKWIWPFVLAQNILNLLYMGVAALPDPMLLGAHADGSLLGWLPVTVLITLESAGAGLGTAVFMVYLMRTCDPAHKAGHMAIVTALMSVSFTLAGVFSGYLVEEIGFESYFGFTFLATIPGMLLIFFIPYLDGRTLPSDSPDSPDSPEQ